jgi:ketosteroid isomerase-like protein
MFNQSRDRHQSAESGGKQIMTTGADDILVIAINYLRAIEAEVSVEELTSYYAESVEQIEYPNRLIPQGTKRNLNDLKEGFLKGKTLLASQTYDIQKSYVVGNTVILETIWTAKLAVPLGQLPAGGEMKAYFAQFIEFEDGKIIRQRTYDCFEPF